MKIAHVAEDKNPVVLGRLGREPGLPTIAFYGHYDVQVSFSTLVQAAMRTRSCAYVRCTACAAQHAHNSSSRFSVRICCRASESSKHRRANVVWMDVQPAMERDWRTDPFDMASIDGYLYGRGTSDNKVAAACDHLRRYIALFAYLTSTGLISVTHTVAVLVCRSCATTIAVLTAADADHLLRVCLPAQGPILAFIYAVKELQQAASREGRQGGLGANIAFVFEGEEENGSGGFRNAVRQNMQWCGEVHTEVVPRLIASSMVSSCDVGSGYNERRLDCCAPSQ